MEPIYGRKTIQASQWTWQLLGGASELFSKGKDEGQSEEDELVRPIGWSQSTDSGNTAKR
ncbi:hypothetical protein [Vulcanococcus limneticus]|uniref:hypothetical protein n=1 Tax=Vulcanococcus limneticus TaxID=2170428 RepID=UPI00398BFCF3